MYGCPHARLCRLDCPRILRLNSRTCSRTYCGCLRTSLRTKHIFLRTIIASIYECDFREENHMVVGHFKRYFKYTLYIIISMNIVMSTSKDWSFIQIFAYLWSFLSISAFVSIIFCNFFLSIIYTAIYNLHCLTTAVSSSRAEYSPGIIIADR